MRRGVPLFITFVVGTLLIFSVFIPPMETLGETFTLFFDIIAVFAFFLGGGNLLRVHITKLQRQKRDWPYSIVTLVGFALMLCAGLLKIGNPDESPGWYLDDMQIVSDSQSVFAPQAPLVGPNGWLAGDSVWSEGIPKVGPDTARSGEMCVATVPGGLYPPETDSRLTTPQISIPRAVEKPRLEFWQWYSFNAGDTGRVLLRVVGDTTWHPLGKAFSKVNNVWVLNTVDLSAWADSTVELAFDLHSEDWGGIANSVTTEGSLFQTIYRHMFVPLGSTMYALLAFFVASASYRAFRAKNREATILLIAAFIILLGRTPIGPLLTGWIPTWLSFLQFDNLAIWIMTSPNLAGQRAIIIGIGLGVVAMSLRLILGIERTYLGDDSG